MAHEEAFAIPSLHVEVEEEGARGLGTRVQPPAPKFPDAPELAAHHPDKSAFKQLESLNHREAPNHDGTFIDMDVL